MVGQFNEQLANHFTAENRASGRTPVIWTVGERIRARLENVNLAVTQTFPTPGSVEAISILITEILLDLEAARICGEVDEITVIHNRSLPGGFYEESSARLLPLDEQWHKQVAASPWPTKLLPEVIHPSPPDIRIGIIEYIAILA